MKIQRNDVAVVGQCNFCGTCCRKISLEVGGRWIRSKEQFLIVVTDYPEYDRFEIVGRDSQGFLQFSCNRCDADGLCTDHDRRLSICRDFPDKSLYFCGGEVPAGCGYRFTEIVPFKKYLDQEIEKQ